MSRFDIAGDARRTIDIIKRGGIAIVPNDTGYACCGASMDPLRKIYDTKRRGSHKRNAMAGDIETQRELHRLSPRAQEMVEALVLDHDLPIGVIGSFRPDHPLLRSSTTTRSRPARPSAPSACCSMPGRSTRR